MAERERVWMVFVTQINRGIQRCHVVQLENYKSLCPLVRSNMSLRRRYVCPQCNRVTKTSFGLTSHYQSKHPRKRALDPTHRQQFVNSLREAHPILDGFISLVIWNFFLKNIAGTPCDENGNNLPAGTPPPSQPAKSNTDWGSYETRIKFELAEELYLKNQASASSIDRILDIWAADNLPSGKEPPFDDHHHLYSTIDSSEVGETPWQSFNLSYCGEAPAVDTPEWMKAKHEVWYRDPKAVMHDLLSNPDFKDEFDYTPYREFRDGKRRWSDFMSGNWSWNQSVCIPSVVLILFNNGDSLPGRDQQRQNHPWRNVCAHYPWQRQNHCFCCNG